MSSNIREFRARLNLYSEETVPSLARARVAAVAMEAARGVVELTPVDTGRLKGNWQVALVDPPTGEIDRVDASPEGTSGSNPVLGETLTEMQRWQMGQMVWLHNGVPYAVHQEDGTERMPGRHMVARTVARLERSFG